MEDILSLKIEDMERLEFNDLIEKIERIKDYFHQNDVDIELALKLYGKAVDLLSIARKKLINFKHEKEQIDKKYREFLESLENENEEGLF
ncbi:MULTISPECIES: exodeoxyribonuclease VII [Thermosipho]|uniref:Exodeoxyribonuclease VII n=1 Tax=Thermosipho affectus TaxID=660294 RepID=A0ABX3IJJ9_9BACT|nr:MULTISPECIES: exodeoxyribonuclease VII [Thermosipho]ANQ53137.1 exodeoxyribonuclease VII [Thermosipho sp. 1070]APT71586.1 exodeoxyribonuclease VII [Thermosipho sp. 1063]MBT1248669.1 exodeoxyribonuclease VII [Thermosipho sp. 1244]ONN28004.1 exodeoxyribonuclease VII [Thermosipho affectus]OOC45662.1 exodeoxyribonuclease VII [Thermosipho sp. 1074]